MGLDQIRRALGLADKPRTPIEWLPLRDDAKELESMEAWPRGAVAFDIIFDESRVPYIVEMHGVTAGVSGISELEPSDVLSGIPKIDDGQLDFWIDEEQTEAEKSKRLKELDDLQKLARTWSLRGLDYENPEWFAGERGITRDKRRQPRFIREENRPETVEGEQYATLFLNHPRIVLKPPDESQGKGVRIFKASEIKEADEYAANLKKRYGGLVAQHFIKSRGADLAPQDLRGHAQSLRLIVPFKFNDKGEIEVEIAKFGYQRVARYSETEVEEGARLRGKKPQARDASVVNLGWDAAAIPMSDTEYELALQAALPTIKELTEFAKQQPEHVDKIRKILFDTARRLQTELNEKYKLRIEYLSAEYPSRFDKNYAAEVQKAFEDTKDYLHFLRFIERDLSIIPAKFWESRKMRANQWFGIERIPNSRNATIRLFSSKRGSRKVEFELRTEKNEDAAGSLKSLLETW